MKEKILPILGIVIFGLLVGNLIVLDIFWLKSQKRADLPTFSASLLEIPSNRSDRTTLMPTPPVSSVDEVLSKETPAADNCGSICEQTINQKVAEAMATISAGKTLTVAKETTVVKEVAGKSTQPQVIYIPLGGGGSTTSQSWADVGNAEVYVNIDDYTNVDRIYFEGFIKVKHGNGKVFARLYDVTHGIGVQGGEISAGSEDYSLVESGSLSLWSGKNLYRVQIKSLNGYEAFYDSGRIKIIFR